MYSRRFYGGERTQRNRPSPTAATPSERIAPTEKKVERSMAEALPMMALVIPVTEEGITPPKEYPNPRDFLPEANERRLYDAPQLRSDGINSENIYLNNEKSEVKDETAEILREVSVYPDNIPQMPMLPDPPSDTPDVSEDSENTPEADGKSDLLNGNLQDTDNFDDPNDWDSTDSSDNSDSSDKSDVYDKMGDISLSMRNMTFEDMMLTGLLMLGSSGEYDDDIMLILGLILMMGA